MTSLSRARFAGSSIQIDITDSRDFFHRLTATQRCLP